MYSTLSAVIATFMLYIIFRLKKKSGKQCLEEYAIRPIPGLQPANER